MNLYYCPIEDIPLSMCVRPQGTSGGSVFNLGADRNAAEAALNGILTRIEYPTGGSSEFEYELHDFCRQTAIPKILILNSNTSMNIFRILVRRMTN